jgi:hypothetical protein
MMVKNMKILLNFDVGRTRQRRDMMAFSMQAEEERNQIESVQTNEKLGQRNSLF